jgi:tetratricopeptide (TPR) repeat protein
MATNAIRPFQPTAITTPGGSRLPVLWRDPHSVPPGELKKVIASLEQACAENPASADLRTCLGMAHAMNYNPYRSMDALEEARALEPNNFLAQFKYAELHYRLRALDVAEPETQKALALAGCQWEIALARHQLSEIRRLRREGTQKPTWTKSLIVPVLALASMMAVICYAFTVFK